MKSEIVELMKQQLHGIADRLTLENFEEMEAEIGKIFTILESTKAMAEDVRQVSESEPEEQKPTEEKVEEESKEKQEEEKEVPGTITGPHVFERKIKGGFIPDIDAFVPEKIINELGLSHGDKVMAEFLFRPDVGPARYNYEIVEKQQPPIEPEDIVPVSMGVVEYVPRLGSYGITKTVNDPAIIFKGDTLILPLKEEDIEALSLKQGDIVNAAFYKENPQYVRVRWKYSTEEYEEATVSRPKPSGYYKKKDEKEKEKLPQIFEGKKICVLGYEPGWASFREEVEKRGGELLTVTGRESFDSLFATIKKADCVIMMTGHVGHTGTIFTVDFCKKHNIPQDELQTFGRTSFINKAKELLEIKD